MHMLDEWFEKQIQDRKDLDSLRELKVRLPLWYHMRMHGLKLLHDQCLSETVKVALRHYFDAVERGDIAPDGTPSGAEVAIAAAPRTP